MDSDQVKTGIGTSLYHDRHASEPTADGAVRRDPSPLQKSREGSLRSLPSSSSTSSTPRSTTIGDMCEDTFGRPKVLNLDSYFDLNRQIFEFNSGLTRSQFSDSFYKLCVKKSDSSH